MSSTRTATDAPEVIAGITAAVVAHVGLAAAFLISAWTEAAAAEDRQSELLAGEVLMLGEVMPLPGELPWIANPEQAPENAPPPDPTQPPPPETAPPDQEVVRLNEAPPEQTPERTVENQARTEPQNRDAPERTDRGETNPNRPTNNDPTIGSREGMAGGTSLSPDALRNQYAIIQAQIQREIRRPRSISDSEYAALRARVYIRATAQGRISSWEFEDRSGNILYDSAIETALNAFREGTQRLQLNALNEEVRTRFIENGLILNIRGE